MKKSRDHHHENDQRAKNKKFIALNIKNQTGDSYPENLSGDNQQ